MRAFSLTRRQINVPFRSAIQRPRAALMPLVHLQRLANVQVHARIMRCIAPGNVAQLRTPQYSDGDHRDQSRHEQLDLQTRSKQMCDSARDKTDSHHQQIKRTGHQIEKHEHPGADPPEKSVSSHAIPPNKNTPERPGCYSTLTVLKG